MYMYGNFSLLFVSVKSVWTDTYREFPGGFAVLRACCEHWSCPRYERQIEHLHVFKLQSLTLVFFPSDIEDFSVYLQCYFDTMQANG